MNPVQLFKQLDELLYEVMSWVIFYPVTLWRAVRRPVTMMDYAESELKDRADQQYTDVLGPPLFLLLSVLLAHGVELALIGDSPMIADRHGLAILIDSDTNLIILRLICFAIFPLTMAVAVLVAQRRKLDRDNLRRPFFAQCYATAPFALLFSLGATLSTTAWTWMPLLVMPMILATIIWYLVVQTRWLPRRLPAGWWRAFGIAFVAYVAALLALIAISPLFT